MKKKKEEPKFVLHFGYDSWCVSGGDAIDPDERWSSRTPATYDSKVYGIFKNKSSDRAIMWESVEVPEEIYNRDKLYLVIVMYSDGDTFGNSSGHMKIADYATTYEEACQIKDIILHNDKARINNKYCYDKKAKMESIAYDPKACGYVCWDGYFNSLECVKIQEYEITDTPRQDTFYP